MRRFLIVVDMQKDFVAATGALSVPGAEALIRPSEYWLAALTPADVAGVLFTFDTHDPAAYAASPESALFPPHCVRGTPGWAAMLDPASIDPAIPVYRLEKSVFDMWEEPDLLIRDNRNDDAEALAREPFFRALKVAGITSVFVIGVATDYCVRWAINGLVERGFDVVVPLGLTRGIDRQIAEVIAEEFAEAPVATSVV